MTAHLWAQQPSAELKAVRDRVTLIIPVGSTEQHGPHLPVSVDAMVAEHLAHAAADRLHREGHQVLAAPVLPYGASHHHLPHPGTLSLSGPVLHAVLRDLLASAAVTGLHSVVILNGHGGNDDLIRQAARDVAVDHDIRTLALSYWSAAWDDLAEAAAGHGIHPVPGHAGAFETSLVLALRPSSVRTPLPTRPTSPPGNTAYRHPLQDPVVERHGWIDAIGGFTDSPAMATAGIGHQLLNIMIAAVTDHIRAFAEETTA